MLFFKSLKWEYRLSIIFAISAFILSLIIGIVSINDLAVVLGRTFVFSLLFALLGFLTIFILRKYVPEIFEVKINAHNAEDTVIDENKLNHDESLSGENTDNLSEDISDVDSESKKVSEPENMNSESIEGSENYLDNPVESSSTSMGRHVFKDEGVKYEPKLMAEAIRTMMSKDSE